MADKQAHLAAGDGGAVARVCVLDNLAFTQFLIYWKLEIARPFFRCKILF